MRRGAAGSMSGVPRLAQVRSLRDLGVDRAARRAFFAGRAVLFSLPTTGGEPILGAVQYGSGRLRCGIISIRALSGEGASAFARFRQQSLAVARAFGASELELFGGAIVNPRIEAMLLRQGFIRATEIVPDELGGGTMEILTRVFSVE